MRTAPFSNWSVRHRPSSGLVLVLAGLAVVVCIPSRLLAQPGGAGMVLPVPSGKIAELAERIDQLIEKPLQRFEKELADGAPQTVFRLICDFNPDNLPNSTEKFGPCSDLADKLRDLQKKKGIQITAYVHGEVSGHCVLPVLACSGIIMSHNAVLGPIIDPSRTLDPDKRLAYERIARNRSYPLILVHKMHDRDLVVVRLRGVQGPERFRDANARPAPQGEPIPELGRNVTASYNFERARDYNFCSKDACDDIKAVLDYYQLPHSALSQPPENPLVWQMNLGGPVNASMHEKVMRHVRRALGQKANVLVFRLECVDGDSMQAYELAMDLARINDNRMENPVETMAYVTPQARNTATFLALACDKIVMHPEARLGDFERYLQDYPTMEGAIGKNLASVAEKKRYSPVLARGMLDRNLRIVWAVSGRGERVFLDENTLNQENKESEEKKQGPRWNSIEMVKPARPEDASKYLTLDAVTAKRLGVAYEVAPKVDAIYSLVGVGPGDVKFAESDMLDDLAEFLRNPWTRLILIMVGITCLFLEMKIPGATLPGVISAVCFVLFFWAHSQLHGQMTFLALLLFLLGLVLLAIEIFILPGFGVCGLSGMILIVGSLGLVAYGHWPRSPEEWMGYGRALGPMGIALMGAICMAFLLARYIPSIPGANRLLLMPLTDENGDNDNSSAPLATPPEMAALLGAIGVAATPLRPAGKTQFGDAFVDVIAEGNYVQPGARVQVIEIEGNRVVVKEV